MGQTLRHLAGRRELSPVLTAPKGLGAGRSLSQIGSTDWVVGTQ